MNSYIETLNHWGGNFLNFAWPMLWQSSLLIVTLFAVDFAVRRKIRASIRYALWLVVLVKLCVPPTLALPTSPAWWLHKTLPPAAKTGATHFTVTYDSQSLPENPQNPLPVFAPPKPAMTNAAWLLLTSTAISSALLLWLLARWWQIARQVRRAKTSERLTEIAAEAQKFAGMKFKVRVKLTANSMTPAVCGLFHPVILIPQSPAEEFSGAQLRAVLLHELIHLRRRDVWLNLVQALLQIFYWWHPLLWLANARIRRVREEAVDDAVMLALRDEAESYAPALLEVAKLALNRPLASLGLVGILESRSALRQRIERLVDFRPPRKVGLTLASFFGILAFTTVAVPMGGAPAETTNQLLSGGSDNWNQTNSTVPTPAGISRRTDAAQNPATMTFRIRQTIRSDDLKKNLIAAGVRMPPTFLFLSDYGILLAHGSKEQLALMRRVVLQLNGYPTNEIADSDKQFVKQTGAIGFEDTLATNLFMRSFRVDAHVFTGTLRSIPDLQTNSVSTMARSLFSKLGVDWESPKGKSVFFNERPGLLFVKATESDLDTIERAIQALNQVGTQVHIKARFLEVPDGTSQDLVTPNLLTNAPMNALRSETNVWAGLMADEKFKIVLRALEAKPGVETLAEPEAITISGRQTRMRATTIINVVTNFTFQETSTNSAITPQTVNVETGPVLDTTPYVLSDGYTINLTITASLTEFLGYDQPPTNAVGEVTTNPNVHLPVVLPSFCVRQFTAHLNLWDNQTVVLGKLEKHFYDGGKEVSAEPDYFVETKKARGQPDEEDKELLVFITVTLVNPVGNRIHSEDEMPFAKDAIPPQ
jgi:beta-lactamase regulating signal transducer with metallopeptidase domain/Flp pilus assembly secretin CpaC